RPISPTTSPTLRNRASGAAGSPEHPQGANMTSYGVDVFVAYASQMGMYDVSVRKAGDEPVVYKFGFDKRAVGQAKKHVDLNPRNFGLNDPTFERCVAEADNV